MLDLDVQDEKAIAALSNEEAKNAVRWLRDRGRDEDASRVAEVAGVHETPSEPPTDPGQVPVAPAPEGLPEGFSNFNVDEVLDWVGEDSVRAGLALQAELERDNPRKGVTDVLEAE